MIDIQNRIHQLFEGRKGDEKIMSLFLTAGYPDLESTPELILGLEARGADMIELGMPFSDPLADGPTIQFSSEAAIRRGITMDRIFDMVRKVREDSQIPVILMGYINPVLHYGVDRFCEQAADAGVDGLIIPDIPVEETYIIDEPARKHGIPLVYLVAPNTSDERMRLIDEKSAGFVYCVSVTGVTGARSGQEVADSVNRFIDRVVANVRQNPKMIGFGIKNHADAMKISARADGFIVGSALIDTIRSHYPQAGWKDKVFAFVSQLKYGK